MQPKPSTRPATTPSSPQHQLSRSSLSSLTYRNVNKYPKCQYKKQHNKQLLNLICLNQGCKGRGPICVMCKSSQHATHMVIPMKKFLDQVQLCLDRRTSAEEKKEKNVLMTQPIMIIEEPGNEQQKIPTEPSQKIQQCPSPPMPSKSELQMQQIHVQKQKMLYNLSLHINVIAEQIRKIEERIISEADQAVEQAKNSINMERNLNNIATELKEQEYTDVGIYRGRVLALLNMVRYKTKDDCELNKEGASKIFEDVVKMSESFIANLEEWSSQSTKMLNKIFEPNSNIKKIQKEKSQPNLTQYKFSTELKIKSVQLSNQNKTAKLNEKLPGFVLAVGPSLKEKKIKVKITNLSNAIMVGVGFKDVIKDNHFKFNPSAIGHGAYMISHNQYTYSHHNKANNMVMKGLSFATGQQLTISLKGESITFMKKSDPKTVNLTMKKLTEDEWKQLAVCVFLGGVGDKVDFIQ